MKRPEINAFMYLQAVFMKFPEPHNNFELFVPDEEEGVNEGDVEGGESVEDAAWRDARIKKRKAEAERELARRSEGGYLGLRMWMFRTV
jgi:hypothetical protein